MSLGSCSLSDFNGLSQHQANELEIFRRRFIDGIDEFYTEFEPKLDQLGKSTSSFDDNGEIARIKIEFDQLQKREREFYREEIFQYFAPAPSKSYCNNSNQYLLIRNQRLATSINDIERLFWGESDEENPQFLNSDMLTINNSCQLKKYSAKPMQMHDNNNTSKHTKCNRNHQINFVFKLKRFFSCF